MQHVLALLLLLILGASAEPVGKTTGKPHDFWKLESEKAGETTTVTTFGAKKAPAKGQGVLMCASTPGQAGAQPAPFEPSVVLGALYSDLKDFTLLGSKDTVWGGQTGRLIAFKALVGKRPVVGRALLAQTADGGSEILLLVTNHDAQQDFKKEFERLQNRWEFGRPAASNVLYSD